MTMLCEMRIAQLELQLAAERDEVALKHAALMGSVRQWEGEREVRQRAEKERDAARQNADDWKVCAEREIAARERGEADNAALATRLQTMCDAAMKSDWMGPDGEREARFPWDQIEFALRDLHTKHPGAALLAEVEALREFHRAFLEVLVLPLLEQADRDGEHKYMRWEVGAARLLLNSHAAVDALKAKP